MGMPMIQLLGSPSSGKFKTKTYRGLYGGLMVSGIGFRL